MTNYGTRSLKDTFAGKKYQGVLYLSNLKNNITKIPKAITTLHDSLTYLKIIDTTVKKLHEYVFKLTKLQTLLLQNNHIKTIPSEIAELTDLYYLYLYKNKLNDLPEEIGVLQNLTDLDLSYNRFKVFPTVITTLANLQYLNISYNSFKHLPISLFKLNQLHYLNLSETSITDLPEAIGNLQNLVTLNIKQEKPIFKTLPVKGLKEMKKLRSLILSEAQIELFKRELGELEGVISKH
jgi:Leucine-rich repeat (LRR) protein